LSLNKNHGYQSVGELCKPDEEDSFVLLTQDTRHISTTSFIKITSTSKASVNTKKRLKSQKPRRVVGRLLGRRSPPEL